MVAVRAQPPAVGRPGRILPRPMYRSTPAARRLIFAIIGWLTVSLLPGTSLAAEPLPRSILVISEAAVGGPFYPAIFSALQTAVNKTLGQHVSVFLENIGPGQFSGPRYEKGLRDFLAIKYGEKSVGVIVAVGRSALEYVLLERNGLWPNVPVVFVFVNRTSIERLILPPDVTGYTTTVGLRDMVSIAQAVVPGLRQVALLGDRLDTQVAYQHIKDEIPSAAVDVIDLTARPVRELRKLVAVLPNSAAIIYTSIYSDGEGTFYPPVYALKLLAEVANRPIVIPVETFLGNGGMGGMIITASALGDGAARLALRILDGESASTIPITESGAAMPIFDWRELQRWAVDQSRLPAGSEIRFRPPTAWEQYRWQILSVTSALLIQAVLIIGLLYEHRRRQLAEAESLKRVNELARMSRIATAGELSASIAHEVNQPLAAMVANANAVLRFLASATPDFDDARAALTSVVSDGHRAGEIVGNVRAIFKKDNEEKTPLELNVIVQDVVSIMHGELEARGIFVQTQLSYPLPFVLGRSSQLQQVISNLLRNAAEAMDTVSDRARELRVKSAAWLPDGILVSVEDSGPGIDPNDTDKIFESFYTTKSQGMGMGLSICRSIVTAHGGRLWAAPGVDHGAVFNIQLPAAHSGRE